MSRIFKYVLFYKSQVSVICKQGNHVNTIQNNEELLIVQAGGGQTPLLPTEHVLNEFRFIGTAVMDATEEEYDDLVRTTEWPIHRWNPQSVTAICEVECHLWHVNNLYQECFELKFLRQTIKHGYLGQAYHDWKTQYNKMHFQYLQAWEEIESIPLGHYTLSHRQWEKTRDRLALYLVDWLKSIKLQCDQLRLGGTNVVATTIVEMLQQREDMDRRFVKIIDLLKQRLQPIKAILSASIQQLESSPEIVPCANNITCPEQQLRQVLIQLTVAYPDRFVETDHYINNIIHQWFISNPTPYYTQVFCTLLQSSLCLVNEADFLGGIYEYEFDEQLTPELIYLVCRFLPEQIWRLLCYHFDDILKEQYAADLKIHDGKSLSGWIYEHAYVCARTDKRHCEEAFVALYDAICYGTQSKWPFKTGTELFAVFARHMMTLVLPPEETCQFALLKNASSYKTWYSIARQLCVNYQAEFATCLEYFSWINRAANWESFYPMHPKSHFSSSSFNTEYLVCTAVWIPPSVTTTSTSHLFRNYQDAWTFLSEQGDQWAMIACSDRQEANRIRNTLRHTLDVMLILSRQNQTLRPALLHFELFRRSQSHLHQLGQLCGFKTMTTVDQNHMEVECIQALAMSVCSAIEHYSTTGNPCAYIAQLNEWIEAIGMFKPSIPFKEGENTAELILAITSQSIPILRTQLLILIFQMQWISKNVNGKLSEVPFQNFLFCLNMLPHLCQSLDCHTTCGLFSIFRYSVIAWWEEAVINNNTKQISAIVAKWKEILHPPLLYLYEKHQTSEAEQMLDDDIWNILYKTLSIRAILQHWLPDTEDKSAIIEQHAISIVHRIELYYQPLSFSLRQFIHQQSSSPPSPVCSSPILSHTKSYLPTPTTAVTSSSCPRSGYQCNECEKVIQMNAKRYERQCFTGCTVYYHSACWRDMAEEYKDSKTCIKCNKAIRIIRVMEKQKMLKELYKVSVPPPPPKQSSSGAFNVNSFKQSADDNNQQNNKKIVIDSQPPLSINKRRCGKKYAQARIKQSKDEEQLLLQKQVQSWKEEQILESLQRMKLKTESTITVHTEQPTLSVEVVKPKHSTPLVQTFTLDQFLILLPSIEEKQRLAEEQPGMPFDI